TPVVFRASYTFLFSYIYFFTASAITEIYTLSLHDALPILVWAILAFVTNFIPNIGFVIGLIPPMLLAFVVGGWQLALAVQADDRSEEHTSELQSRRDLVCRLLLEKKKNMQHTACYSER